MLQLSAFLLEEVVASSVATALLQVKQEETCAQRISMISTTSNWQYLPTWWA